MFGLIVMMASAGGLVYFALNDSWWWLSCYFGILLGVIIMMFSGRASGEMG